MSIGAALNPWRTPADTHGMSLPQASEGPRIIRSSKRTRSPGVWPSLGYEIEPTVGLVGVDLFEALDVPQLAHALEVILRDDAFRPGFHLCVDCRHLREAPSRERLFATGAEVRTVGLSWQVGRIAIVVRRSHTQIAARCLPMVLPSGLIERTRVVIDLRDAFAWFDVHLACGG